MAYTIEQMQAMQQLGLTPEQLMQFQTMGSGQQNSGLSSFSNLTNSGAAISNGVTLPGTNGAPDITNFGATATFEQSTEKGLTGQEKFDIGLDAGKFALSAVSAYDSHKQLNLLEDYYKQQAKVDKININNQVATLNSQYEDLSRLRQSRGQSAPDLNLQTLG